MSMTPEEHETFRAAMLELTESGTEVLAKAVAGGMDPDEVDAMADLLCEVGVDCEDGQTVAVPMRGDLSVVVGALTRVGLAVTMARCSAELEERQRGRSEGGRG